MKFAKSAPAVLIAAVVVVVAALSFVSNLISHQMANSFEQAQFELVSQIVKSRLHGAESQAISSAELVAAMPAVKKAFAARDRAELLAVTRDAFAAQHEKYGISQAQFHLAPAVSFLRVHNPEKFGEDLAKYRQIVVEVNQANAIRKGIEITTSGIGVFGTLPMTDAAGKSTGSFEMGLEVGPLLDELKKDHGFEMAFFVDEQSLRETATSLKGDIFSEQNRVGKYVKFYATHAELLRPLVVDADINISDESHYVRDSAGVAYGVLLQPVYNYAKKPIGVIAIAKNFSATRSADKQAILWQTLLGIVAIVLLTGVVLVVIRGMLLQPLQLVGDRFADLADGKAGAEDAPPMPSPLCDEIAGLAGSYERLRAQKAGATPAAGEVL
ncbi:cache domain-containing protein [Polaromonas sp. YR568]|uniref:cache domain-containing protein n=1 Tax=Polaromonas sp. YR568 TaxID=1855301 RepID=UPI00398BCE4A